MSSMYEKRAKAWYYASEIIRQITNETKEEQEYRFVTDKVYYDTIRLIMDMFLTIEKNHDFKNELNNAMKESLLKTSIALDNFR